MRQGNPFRNRTVIRKLYFLETGTIRRKSTDDEFSGLRINPERRRLYRLCGIRSGDRKPFRPNAEFSAEPEPQ